MGYHLAGMPMDTPMLIGMFLIIVGFGSSFYGLYPPSAGPNARALSHIGVRALDEARITKTHIALLVVMAIALTIDVMKTTTLAFVAPGMALEYGLRSQLNPAGVMSVTYLPLSGITGTVLGSFCRSIDVSAARRWRAVTDRVVIQIENLGDRRAAHAIVEQQQRMGSSRQPGWPDRSARRCCCQYGSRSDFPPGSRSDFIGRTPTPTVGPSNAVAPLTSIS